MELLDQMNDTYLDYNATAPVWPEVVEAVSLALVAGGNASSVHEKGRVARQMVEEAREKVAALVHAVRPDGVSCSIVNTDAEAQRTLIVQAGAFCEHRFTSAQLGDGRTVEVDGPHLQLRLAPGAAGSTGWDQPDSGGTFTR